MWSPGRQGASGETGFQDNKAGFYFSRVCQHQNTIITAQVIKKMKKVSAVLIVLALLLIFWAVPVSAAKGGNITTITYQLGTGEIQYELGLGDKYTKIGTVTVSNDAANLYVRYDTLDGWAMTDTHLAVSSGSTLDAAVKQIPTSLGQFDKGKWPASYWGGAHTGLQKVTTDTYTVPLKYFTFTTGATTINALKDSQWVAIAAHAVIVGKSSGTAWANGAGGKPTFPTPEMPTVALLGIGLAGLAGFGWFRYKKVHLSPVHNSK